MKPASPTPLSVLRIGVAAVLLYQATALCSSVSALFGPNGFIEWGAVRSPGAFPMDFGGPFHLSKLAGLAEIVGVSSQTVVQIVFGLYVASLIAMFAGFFTRTSTATVFLMHLMLTSTAVATTYGVDQFARIALFYCVCFPTGARYSFDASGKDPSKQTLVSARIGIRMLQLHIALMYLATGLHKASGPQWWDGEAIWRAITLPQLATVDLTWMSAYPDLLIMIGWSTLAIEIGYVAFVWHRRTRPLIVGSIIGMHVGIALILGLVSFAMIMIVLNIAAFLIPADGRITALRCYSATSGSCGASNENRATTDVGESSLTGSVFPRIDLNQPPLG